MTLLEMLSSVEDSRSRHGLRHSLPDVLMMCIMAIMSGYQCPRAINRFLKRHEKEFRKTFRLLHPVPSHVTIGNIIADIDFDKFSKSFNQWALQFLPMCHGDTKAIDGKAIGGTVTDSSSSYQNFVSIVSVFASQRGIVLACDRLENKKTSEIPTVQSLISALDIQGEVFTMDAIHCQKKRQR